MTPLDQQFFLLINHGLHSTINNWWIGYATWLGNGWIGFPLAIVALLVMDRAAFWRNLALLAIAGIVGGIALNLIKHAVHAPRPLTVFGPEITASKMYVNIMFERLYWNSFPSGHSQTIFTISTCLLWVQRRAERTERWASIAIIAVSLLVCISRIYVGAHFPSDVLGGALLGAGSALLCCFGVSALQEKWLSSRSARS